MTPTHPGWWWRRERFKHLGSEFWAAWRPTEVFLQGDKLVNRFCDYTSLPDDALFIEGEWGHEIVKDQPVLTAGEMQIAASNYDKDKRKLLRLALSNLMPFLDENYIAEYESNGGVDRLTKS